MAKNVAKRHPNDGKMRYDYVESKIAHMKRIGVVSAKSTGRHPKTGGACPDHNK